MFYMILQSPLAFRYAVGIIMSTSYALYNRVDMFPPDSA